MWDARKVAEELGYSYEYFRKEVRFWPEAPKPLNLPGYPRWAPEDWIAWRDKFRNSSAKAA